MFTQQQKGRKMGKTIFLFGFVLILIPGLLNAQQYPTKPINILVGYAAGGTFDVSLRFLASKAEKDLGQPCIISNNGGGGGTVALGIVAKQRPDGYSLLGIASSALTMNPHYRSVPYKFDDFAYIMYWGGTTTALVVKADSPWKTMREFVEYAKKNPGKVTYSTLGVGSTPHLSMEYVAKQEGIQWTHVPYPGDIPATAALLGGHVTASSGGATWAPHVLEGTLRLLAAANEKRLRNFPDIPTFRELGYDFFNETRYLLAAPKGVPPSIIKKLDEVFHKPMDDPEFVQIMERSECPISYRNSAGTKKFIEESYVRLGKIITELKIPKESGK